MTDCSRRDFMRGALAAGAGCAGLGGFAPTLFAAPGASLSRPLERNLV